MKARSICIALSIGVSTLLSSGVAWSASPTCTNTSVPNVNLSAPAAGQKYWAAHRGVFRFTPMTGYRPGDLTGTYKDESRSVPENSLAAVIAACAAGFPAVEIDIRPGVENSWVLHEPTLDRMVSYTLTYGQIRRTSNISRQIDPTARGPSDYMFFEDSDIYLNTIGGSPTKVRAKTKSPLQLTVIPRYTVWAGQYQNLLTLRNYANYDYNGINPTPFAFTVYEEPKFTNFFNYLKNDSRFDNMWFVLDSDYNTLYTKIGEVGRRVGEGNTLNGMRVVWKFYTSQMTVNAAHQLADTANYQYGPWMVLMFSDQNVKYTGSIPKIHFRGLDGSAVYLTVAEVDAVIKQIQNAGGRVIGVEPTKTGRLPSSSRETTFMDTVATHYDGDQIGRDRVYRWGSYRTRDLQWSLCQNYPTSPRRKCSVFPNANYTYWTEMYSYPPAGETLRNNFSLAAQVITGDLK